MRMRKKPLLRRSAESWAAVIFRRQLVESIAKILAPGHCDQEWIQSCYALWNRGLCFPLDIEEKFNLLGL
jgi:hypothetical protein